MTPAEVEEVANRAANKAVRDVLLTLGIDANSPGALVAAQSDFVFLRELHTGTKTLKRSVIMAFTGAIVSAILAAVWLALKLNGKTG